MERMGLKYEVKRYCEDILHEILKALRSQRPVIIRVDCYYESLRKDMYLRTHWPHSLLIYGFDLEQQMFHVIEHDHRKTCLTSEWRCPSKILRWLMKVLYVISRKRKMYLRFMHFLMLHKSHA